LKSVFLFARRGTRLFGCFGGFPCWTPSRRERTEALKDYIAALREELEDAEEHLKEVEKRPEERV
jgi:hypothetical protein